MESNVCPPTASCSMPGSRPGLRLAKFLEEPKVRKPCDRHFKVGGEIGARESGCDHQLRTVAACRACGPTRRVRSAASSTNSTGSGIARCSTVRASAEPTAERLTRPESAGARGEGLDRLGLALDSTSRPRLEQVLERRPSVHARRDQLGARLQVSFQIARGSRSTRSLLHRRVRRVRPSSAAARSPSGGSSKPNRLPEAQRVSTSASGTRSEYRIERVSATASCSCQALGHVSGLAKFLDEPKVRIPLRPPLRRSAARWPGATAKRFGRERASRQSLPDSGNRAVQSICQHSHRKPAAG